MTTLRPMMFAAVLMSLALNTGCLSVMKNDGEFARAAEQARCLEEAENDKTCAEPSSYEFYLDEDETDAALDQKVAGDESTIPPIHSDVI